MSLEVRYQKRATPRVRARRAKAKLVSKSKKNSAKSARFYRGEPLAADAVLDISSTGMKLLARGKVLEKGETLSVEIVHPALEETFAVSGVVRWVKPDPKGGESFTAGVEFSGLDAQAREQLERVVTLELGSAVVGARGQVGWVAPAGDETGLGGLLFVYDLGRMEVATIVDEKEYLQATRLSGSDIAQRQATTLEPLLRWVFDLKEGELTVDPPL